MTKWQVEYSIVYLWDSDDDNKSSEDVSKFQDGTIEKTIFY